MSTDLTAEPWPLARPPASSSGWHWTPTGLADLARVRRDLRAGLRAPHCGFAALSDGPADDAVAALDELLSNALRHGRRPITAEVSALAGGYLVAVEDRAADRPPLPTSVRDPADGGMGLGIVATTSLAHGWFPHPTGKTVWAVLPRSDLSG